MIENYFETLALMKRTVTVDEFGGELEQLEPCLFFSGGVTAAVSTQERVYGKPGTVSGFVIATATGVNLTQGDMVRRESDGKLFRVTSNADEMRTPAVAGLQFEQVNAEVIRV